MFFEEINHVIISCKKITIIIKYYTLVVFLFEELKICFIYYNMLKYVLYISIQTKI